jgi:hypothetical protein
MKAIEPIGRGGENVQPPRAPRHASPATATTPTACTLATRSRLGFAKRATAAIIGKHNRSCRGVVAGPMHEGDLASGVVGDARLGNDHVRLPDNSLVSAVAAYFRLWHEADVKLRPLFGRYGMESGHHRLVMSISAFDRSGHYAVAFLAMSAGLKVVFFDQTVPNQRNRLRHL